MNDPELGHEIHPRNSAEPGARWLVSLTALVVCAVALTNTIGSAQAKLFAFDQVSPGSFTHGAIRPPAAADIDGDGDVDMLVTNGLELYVVINDGSGRFTLRSNPVPKPPGPKPPVYVLWGQPFLADFDFDRDPDLLVGIYDGNKSAMLLLENDGQGNFSLQSKFSMPQYTRGGGVTIVDLDRDGDNDILIGYEVFWNNGVGQFTKQELIPNHATHGTSSLSLADFDNDGRLDIYFASADINYPNDELWVDDGKGGYKLHWISPVLYPFHSEAGDVNGDGLVDLLIGVNANPRYIAVYLNDGKTLNPSITIPASGQFKLSDVDGDGDLDLLASPLGAGLHISIFLNDGKGSFTDATANLIEPPGWSYPDFGDVLTLADVDGDGDLDVVGVLDQRFLLRYTPIVLRNRFRHLESPPTAGLGKPLPVTLIGEHQHAMSLALSIKETRLPLAGWGDLRLDAASLILLPPQTLQNRVPGGWNFTVPNLGSLAGLKILFQAVDVPAAGAIRLTGLQRTEIVK